MESERPPAIEPDTKDWTVVVRDGCPDCGFDASYDVTTTGDRLRASEARWRARLGRADVRERPAPDTWSPLEYGAHSRDVLRVMRGRLELMLAEDGASFEGWDQDEASVQDRYDLQDPDQVAQEYADEVAATAEAFDAVEGEQWQHRGSRSGTAFTVGTLAVYMLHDIEHHLVDVSG